MLAQRMLQRQYILTARTMHILYSYTPWKKNKEIPPNQSTQNPLRKWRRYAFLPRSSFSCVFHAISFCLCQCCPLFSLCGCRSVLSISRPVVNGVWSFSDSSCAWLVGIKCLVSRWVFLLGIHFVHSVGFLLCISCLHFNGLKCALIIQNRPLIFCSPS